MTAAAVRVPRVETPGRALSLKKGQSAPSSADQNLQAQSLSRRATTFGLKNSEHPRPVSCSTMPRRSDPLPDNGWGHTTFSFGIALALSYLEGTEAARFHYRLDCTGHQGSILAEMIAARRIRIIQQSYVEIVVWQAPDTGEMCVLVRPIE